LFIVGSTFWITGVEAQQILKHNDDLNGVICSVPVLDELLDRAPYLLDQIDLVHMMVPVAGRRYMKRFLGKMPCVGTIHHLEPGYAPEALSVNAQADCIMVVAHMWFNDLSSRGIPTKRLYLLPNGVDTDQFRPTPDNEREQIRQSFGFQESETVIGFAGQPGRDQGWRKGLDVFIEALKILVQNEQQISVLVGGPGWAPALSKIEALGIKGVRRPYVRDANEGAPMYSALDYFWVASRIEGGPVPLIEAMSAGICCISTKVGMATDIIEDGLNGCLVEIGDAQGLATLTGALMKDSGRRKKMSIAARETVVNNFDWSRTATGAPALYRQASENFRSRNLQPIRNSLSRTPPTSSKYLHGGTPHEGQGLLTPQDRTWLDIQERLIWSRELCRLGERRAAILLAWRACLSAPLSVRTWSFLANLLLPRSVLELGRRAVAQFRS
jgi:glycosyltransferase involved in cell wall biosynthesis